MPPPRAFGLLAFLHHLCLVDHALPVAFAKSPKNQGGKQANGQESQ